MCPPVRKISVTNEHSSPICCSKLCQLDLLDSSQPIENEEVVNTAIRYSIKAISYLWPIIFLNLNKISTAVFDGAFNVHPESVFLSLEYDQKLQC